jgi:hypothetical protein
VSGVVQSVSGERLSRILITIGFESQGVNETLTKMKTNSRGFYHMALEPGSYWMAVESAPTFSPMTATFTVLSNN